ncbi:succinate--CoA ligase subunit alpha [Halodesulfovibrio spirochaetisodalis]|uniref:Succinyl-CoA synthetase subunit beta n=1 Tax=Halodesulfovibrio spirochaetisodalis TaxID=1560234 RepID=A0A1B7XA27_9BACT|nr:succinate--CoA ligase subunit alpha [Halodesulfovibrio spirochaetisodalis]OBQ46192.1 succinyl-CoA synthetase subunit beta [Halodesulfovibrio spirochaetisodalis]
MFLNEHLSKKLFGEAGITVPVGTLLTPESVTVPEHLSPPWYLKAQVLTGGRGKAGGILRADTPEEFHKQAENIFAMKIKGNAVPFIRVEQATEIAKECYLSFVLSRERKDLLFTVSAAGGIEVENSAQAVKPLIQRVHLSSGLKDHHLRAAFFELGVSKEHFAGFCDLVKKLYGIVAEYGLLMAEINPLVITKQGEWMALDGKVELDDNMVEMHPDVLEGYYTPEHHSPEENIAREAGLSYVELKGWVGILVNGAGLAMATMDLLNFNGLTAANFMDLGGAADRERIKRALDLLFGNDDVKAVFINLFGGIVSCKEVGKALLAVLEGEPAPKPIVIRMAGFESVEGRELLKEAAPQNVYITVEMNEALERLYTLKPADAPTVEFTLQEEAPPAGMPAFTRSGIKDVLGLSKDTQVLVQGITGKVAQRHVAMMQEYGTNIVAGVTPFKGGMEVLGVPVYNSVHEAKKQHRIDASIVFVPAAFAADAVAESAAEDIPWVVCITEGVAQASMLSALKDTAGSSTRIIGPNTPGIIVPEQCKIGIMPASVFKAGHVAIFSRSGTLTYEAADRLSRAGIGQSVCVGIGGDSFIGTNFSDLLELVRDDDNTHAVLILGEVGGSAEEDLARYVEITGFEKPVVSFVAARTAPPGKRLGHAGAILEENSGGIERKLQAMRDAGFVISPDLAQLPELVKSVLDNTAAKMSA